MITMVFAKLNIHWVFCAVGKIEITFKEFQIEKALCVINLIF